MSHARARLAVVLASRRLLAPLTLLAFAVIGVYAYRPNDVQGSFAVTAVLSAIVCAWLVTATERELAPSADAILTVAAGGAAQAWRGRLALVAIFTLAVTLVFLVWPTATDAFDRTPGIGDLGAAALAHAASSALGGCLGLALAPPARAATAFAATTGLLLISVALAGTLGAHRRPRVNRDGAVRCAQRSRLVRHPRHVRGHALRGSRAGARRATCAALARLDPVIVRRVTRRHTEQRATAFALKGAASRASGGFSPATRSAPRSARCYRLLVAAARERGRRGGERFADVLR